MQEHPVPQNVTSFEFKLIGDLTLHQFGYVGGGSAIAILLFFVPQTTFVLNLIKYVLMFSCPLCGFALAFLPIEGRPLDRWLVAFIKAVFGNTLYVWKKDGVSYDALNNLSSHVSGGVDQTEPMEQFQTQPAILTENNPLDAEESRILHNLPGMPPPQRPGQRRQPQPLYQSVAKAKAPVPQPVTRPSITRTFAGPISPSRVIPAPMNRPSSLPFPQAMRLPHQKPLTPMNIPLPSYQRPQATMVQRAAPASLSPQPMPAPHPAMGAAAVLQQTYNPAAMQPNPPAQPQELTELREQNQQLFQKLAELQTLIQQKAVGMPPAVDTAAISDEAKSLASHMQDINTTVNQLHTNLTDVSQEESNYQAILNELKDRIDQVSTTKEPDTAKLEELAANKQQQEQALTESEQKRSQAEEELASLKERLEQAQKLSDDLTGQKQTLEEKLQDYVGRLETISQQATPKQPAEPVQSTEAMHNTADILTANPATPEPKVESLASLDAIQQKLAEAVKPAAPVVIPKPEEKPKQASVAADFVSNFPALTKIPNAISGYVFDRTNKPLMDVVIVVKKQNGPTLRALKSDRIGSFSIVTSLPDGQYELNFEKEGYSFAPVTLDAKGEVFPPMKVVAKEAN